MGHLFHIAQIALGFLERVHPVLADGKAEQAGGRHRLAIGCDIRVIASRAWKF